MSSVLFQSGKIIDGSGTESFEGHVLVEGDRIAAVIRAGEPVPTADEVVDASGLSVAPGFIDMHSHLDWVLPLADHEDLLARMVEQGVTSVVGGNCGISPAPMRSQTQNRAKAFASIVTARPLDFTWRSMAEFLDHVEETEPVVNLAQLSGHASIRYAAADTLRGPLAPDELNSCLDLARQTLDEGACGLSFGLGYDPGMYSPLDELEAFCKVAADAGKPATVHLKALSWMSPCYPMTTPSAHNVKALEEMLEVGRRAGVSLQLSHFIFVGRRSWSTAQRCLAMVDEARRSGQDVMIDALPYTSGNTTIHAPFPYWFLAQIPQSYQNKLARARLRAELEIGFRLVGFMYKDFQVMEAGVAGWEDLNGLTIPEIASKWKTSSFDAMLRLAEASHGGTLMLFHTYSGEPGNERPLEAVLSRDYCMFETDAAVKETGYPNPASMGTFPKMLGDFARERKLFSMEDAVKRMTSMSADRFGLGDRGLLAAGKAADLVLFNPETIADTPPVGATPAGRPRGIEQVFVNGVRVVRDGEYVAGARVGKVLRT